jgi:hypothetical protein
LLSFGGAIPLAPTKLTVLAFELDHCRQRGVQSEVDRIRRELVLEALKSQNVELGEDRPDERLLAIGPRVSPEAGERAGVVDDLRRRQARATAIRRPGTRTQWGRSSIASGGSTTARSARVVRLHDA